MAGVTGAMAPSLLPGLPTPRNAVAADLCPERVPRPGFKPDPTKYRCGPATDWWRVAVPQGYFEADFRPACNAHDACYDTCNEDQSRCDSEILEGWKAACRSAYPPQSHPEFGQRTYRQCERIAGLAYGALIKLGGDAYKTAQEAACICCKDLETKCGQPEHEVCCKACETCQGDQCKPKCPDLCSPCDESTGECKEKDCPLCTDCRDGECVPKECQTCEECFLDECVSTCPPDQECCHDQCVDPTCPPGETFNSSTCQCQCATQLCGGQCCPPGQTCCNGQCQEGSGCASRVFCACNGQTYDDVQKCLAECHVTLGCFTGICTPVD